MESFRKRQGDLFEAPPEVAVLPKSVQARLRPLLLALLSEAVTIMAEAAAEERGDDQDHA